jgi:sec-independent protein translocase protein TatB
LQRIGWHNRLSSEICVCERRARAGIITLHDDMTILPTIELASLGMWDSLILMVMALVVFGPRRLPEIGRQIGRLMYEARKLSNEFKFQMEEEFRKAEEAGRQKTEEQRQAALAVPEQAAERSGIVSQASEARSFDKLRTGSGAPGGEVDPAAIAAAPEPTAEEPYPRILPPSTGEPVAAARPGGLAAGEVPVEAQAKADKIAPAADEAQHD